MNYTMDRLEDRISQLEARLEQLNQYEARYDEVTTGFVGAAELHELNQLAQEYEIEHDDWYSDRFEVEKELSRL